ncbi:hypothetical protein LCGC14_1472250 [marine sediment metagenome]|uniref:Uncharacterized protein n=1 Tax=marine sediment metagenome TaxID=412755 RepID=A0A0F9JC07_9ZZZZ
MKYKKRTITVKDPRLQRIRNSLRYIISETAIAESRKLIREESRLSLDHDKERISVLSDKIDKLDAAWKKSICTCSICGSRTSDMTRNPEGGSWYCVKCYQEHHDFYIEKARQGEIWKNGGGRASTGWFP